MNKIAKATHFGELKIGDVTLSVAVLETKQRIISQTTAFAAFGRPMRGSRATDQSEGKLPGLIDAANLKPFINSQLYEVIKPVIYLDASGKKAQGYDASILALICEVYLDVMKAERPNGKPVLTAKQLPNARAAESLSRVLMKIGIIALIDEVTGYQDVRVQDALQKILDQYLLAEAKKYEVTFPLELYKQWFRLNGWDWKPESAQKRPGVIGKWTNKYIYDRMAPCLLKQLEIKNPKNSKGYREHKHFQLLTDDIGEPKLREFFGGLIALARASQDWRKYTSMIEKAYPSIGDQFKLELEE